MPDPAYLRDVSALRGRFPNLGEELAGFTGVSDVLEWMQRASLTRTAVDMVALDEFEYDFLIQLQPEGEWLALGIT